MENEFSFKELYDVVLKATHPFKLGNYTFATGEVVAAFDKIQISSFDLKTKVVTAHGGYNDAPRVVWESVQGADITFAQGIFSESQFALMTNSRMVDIKNENLKIHQREKLNLDDNGYFYLKHKPVLDDNFFIYDEETGEKKDTSNIGEPEETFAGWKMSVEGEPLESIVVDYNFEVDSGRMVEIGGFLNAGFLKLEGRTKVQDDITGNMRTGILTISKLKLISTLSMRLGALAQPVVGTFKAMALPEGDKGASKVMEVVFLDDDIDSDL